MKFWFDTRFYVNELRRIDEMIGADPGFPIPELFSDWPLTLFAELLTCDLRTFPKVEARLPRMPSIDMQMNYNGSSGSAALQLAASFIAATSTALQRYTCRSLAGVRALDYGVGWGRTLRVALKEIPESRFVGCDAWSGRLQMVRSLGFRTKLIAVDAEPKSLPLSKAVSI